jgi:hypothetical protein
MKKFTEKQFTARYNKIMLIVSLVVFVIAATVISVQVSSQERNDDTQLIEQFKTKSLAIDNLISAVTDHLNLMQNQAEAHFLTKAKESGVLFDALSSKDGDSYSLDNIPTPYTKADLGNLTGNGKISNLSQSVKQEIEMAFGLNSLFQGVKTNLPNAAWVYYTSKNKFINIYPWTNSSESHFTDAMLAHEFYAWGLPAVNPEKKIFWTPAYIDDYGKGMMVTAAKPIYHDGNFLGTIAIDVTLEQLNEYVKNFRSSSDAMMIVNQTGQLIAHPVLTSSKDKEIKLLKNVIPVALQSQVDNLFKTKSLKPEITEGYKYIWVDMQNAPWKIVYIAKESSVIFKIFSSVGIVFLALFASLGLMLFGMNRITFREFIHPAENLVRHISMESENKSSSIPRMPDQWLPWFNEITTTFAHNRNLIKEVNEKNQQLTDMNISLERYMPKFILLVNLGESGGGTVTGNYFADILARKDNSKKTVYLEYPVPEKIISDLDLDPAQHTYKHPNGYDILSSYDLGIIPESAKTSLLLTKILDGYDNIVVNAVVRGSVEEFLAKYLEPMFKYSKAIVLVVPPDDYSGEISRKTASQIKKYVRQDQATIYMLLNRPDEAAAHYTGKFDLQIPLSPNDIALSKEQFDVPAPALSVIETLIDRVERVHQISVYIPTTISVDKAIDTSEHLRRTMAFFGTKFGGATSSQAQGVWNSDESGLVNEAVHIVMSYATEDDLADSMDDVIEFIKGIKVELQQEAMAMEINKKLVLI